VTIENNDYNFYYYLNSDCIFSSEPAYKSNLALSIDQITKEIFLQIVKYILEGLLSQKEVDMRLAEFNNLSIQQICDDMLEDGCTGVNASFDSLIIVPSNKFDFIASTYEDFLSHCDDNWYDGGYTELFQKYILEPNAYKIIPFNAESLTNV
jgi:hypothetical protein